MAYGNEVVLGWGLSDYADVGDALGLKLPRSADPEEWKESEDTGVLVEIPGQHDDLLLKAHHNALVEAGFQITGRDDHIGRYILADTPLGKRSFAPFVFELFYDIGEMDDTPETSTFGVALSGRYFPTFLDWKDEHGTLCPVRIDADLNSMIRIARRHIEAAFPVFTSATIIVVTKHY